VNADSLSVAAATETRQQPCDFAVTMTPPRDTTSRCNPAGPGGFFPKKRKPIVKNLPRAGGRDTRLTRNRYTPAKVNLLPATSPPVSSQ